MIECGRSADDRNYLDYLNLPGQYSEINVLGMDFLAKLSFSLIMDMDNYRFLLKLEKVRLKELKNIMIQILS